MKHQVYIYMDICDRLVFVRTSPDASAGDEEGVAEAEEQGAEVDVAQRVEGRHLREESQHDGDDHDEMVQLQGAIR